MIHTLARPDHSPVAKSLCKPDSVDLSVRAQPFRAEWIVMAQNGGQVRLVGSAGLGLCRAASNGSRFARPGAEDRSAPAPVGSALGGLARPSRCVGRHGAQEQADGRPLAAHGERQRDDRWPVGARTMPYAGSWSAFGGHVRR